MPSSHPEPPRLREPRFTPIDEEEAREIHGGRWNAGTCVGIGYACWSKGGVKIGLCAIAGYCRD